MPININRDLAQWLHDRVEEGTLEPQVRAMLEQNGYDATQVRSLCDFAYQRTSELRKALDEFDFEQEHLQPQATSAFEPSATLNGAEGNYLDMETSHGPIAVLARMERPYVVVLGNFLSHDECDALIALARHQLTRAQVVHRDTGEAVTDARRTSEYAMFQRADTELLERIEARTAAITGLPATHGEGIQVMRYGVGAEYKPHFDFFDAETVSANRRLDPGGQRVATLVMYLNDPPRGGATTFPDVGLSVMPHKGSAVYFAYTDAQGESDNLSFHAGAPVADGEKWIASKWLRAQPYFSQT